MNLRYLLVFPILALPHDTAADEGLVYESFSGVTIGRLFLSQSEREYLDVRRLLPLQEGSAGGAQRPTLICCVFSMNCSATRRV